MSKSRLKILCSLMMFGLWTGALPAHSITVAELEDKGRLQVRTWLDPAREIIPGQQEAQEKDNCHNPNHS